MNTPTGNISITFSRWSVRRKHIRSSRLQAKRICLHEGDTDESDSAERSSIACPPVSGVSEINQELSQEIPGVLNPDVGNNELEGSFFEDQHSNTASEEIEAESAEWEQDEALENPEIQFIKSDEHLNHLDQDPEDECEQTCEKGSPSEENWDLRRDIMRLMAAAFYLKYNLSDSALGHFLRIHGVTNPENMLGEFRSPYLFLKQYSSLRNSIKKIYICSVCNKPLAADQNGSPLEQQACGHKYSKESHDGCFVLILPVQEQIKFFLENYELQSVADRDPNYRGDVNTGSFFRKYEKQGFIDGLTLTLQINIDGAQVFNSSKYGFWPCMGIINEAKHSVRRSNVILFALWYGNRKPSIDGFLQHPVEELNKLALTGVVAKGANYIVRPLLITLDSVARPVIRNTTQFNGKCGCDFCLHPGYVVKVGRGHARVYPEPKDGQKHPHRTLHQHLSDLQEVQDTGIPKHGILGDTPFLHIKGFNFVRSFVPDYLHGVCLGVVRYFLLLWVSPKYSKKPWAISKEKQKILNRRLASSKPPYEITRTPRTLVNISYWKASEFRAFVLYYFVLLEDLLPTKYFQHFLLLSQSLYILLADSVHVKEVSKADNYLRQFVKDTELLYGEEHIKYNVHLLTHLAESVMNWGCLWASSTFIPESFNGELVKLCNGTQAVTEQMAETLLIRTAVRSEVISLLEGNNVNPKTGSLFCELLDLPVATKQKFLSRPGRLVHDDRLFGRPCTKTLTPEQASALEHLHQKENEASDRNNGNADYCCASNVQMTATESFPRVSSKAGTIFTTTSYTRSSKRINYCVLLSNGLFCIIEHILLITYSDGSQHVVCLGKILGTQSRPNIFTEMLGHEQSLAGETTKLLGTSNTVTAFRTKDIARKCVVAATNDLVDSLTVTALVNTKETD